MAVIAGIFAFAELSYGGRAARAEEKRLRRKLLRRYYGSPPSNDATTTDEAGTGPSASGVIQLMTDNTERLTEYRQVYFGSTLAAMAIPFVTLAYIGVFIDWVVGFGVMLMVPLIPILIGAFMRLFRKTSAHSRSERARLSGAYLDAIRNLVTIRLLGAGKRIEAQLSTQGEANRGAIMRLLAGNQIVIIVMDGLFALVLICLTAGLTVTRASHMTQAQILAVMLLTVLLLEPLQQVAGFFYIGMGGIASQRAIRAYQSSTEPRSSTDPGSASNPDVSAAQPALKRATQTGASAPDSKLAIEMHDVRFDYGRGEVLAGIDLVVPTGSRTAIIGASGAGKSTLMGLLRGSLAPQHGTITIAGNSVNGVDPSTTRALSATVSQSTWMFTGTIADNLRLAQSDATDDDMWEALRLAHVADEIRAMPNGLNTYLGEGASLISGGQAQRISLARALLSGRRVILLDEPTSQVDVESEARIIAAIADLPRDRTILMITHRRSLLEIADSVVELRDGRLFAKEPAHV